MKLDALIWDLDGVVTDTSDLHMRAWIAALSQEFNVHDSIGNHEYEEYFNGVPRYVGIKRFIDSRLTSHPISSHDEFDIEETARRLSSSKCQIFQSYLLTEDIRVFPDAVNIIRYFQDKFGIQSCLASQSENAEEVLHKANITHLFQTIASGNTAKTYRVKSKPHPDFYRHVSSLANVSLSRSIVFEDTYAGAYASVSAGAFSTIGVARKTSRYSELISAGCDMIVRDLSTLLLLLNIEI